MTQRVLLIGENPDTADFSDPALPPGLTPAKIREGLAAAAKGFADLKIDCDQLLVEPDETAEASVAAALQGQAYDCVVIGGGIRVPGSRLALFERILNTVHRHAPGAAIAFNTRPENSAEAAQRWL